MSTRQPDAPVAGEPGEPEPFEKEAETEQLLLGGNELVTGSFSEYLQASLKRVRSGDSGVLPVVVGLIIIVIIFQTQNSKFLSAINLTNLLQQASVFVTLGLAEVFVLLLGEIDLSAGFTAGVGAVVTAELAAPPHNASWWIAILAGVASCTVIGAVWGLLTTRLGLPSFVVTLAGQIGLAGLVLWLITNDKYATGGTISVDNSVLNDVVNGSLSPIAGWVVMIAAVAVFAVVSILRDRRRRANGLVAPPLALTIIKVGAMAAAGVVLVLVCNTNRGLGFVELRGVPWVVPIVLGVLVAWTLLLSRTRFGRYLYAIGGNKEAARRAGINIKMITLIAFALTSLTAGIGGVIYESQLGSISSNINGGQLVLYAIAAAVIGGTSLFGGRGKMIHAVLGGMVIATIYNGMGLLNISAAVQYMVTALVLLAAVTVDALARRGRTPT
jgi:D-xylose transport system permease protein